MPRTLNDSILRAAAAAFRRDDATFEHAIGVALEALMRQVQCGRVSLWRFEIEAGSRGLRCLIHQLTGQAPVRDATLLREDQYREYFAALALGGVFVANDAMREDKLQAMRGAYLQAHHITALLDLPVTINGRAYGIVCCEQVTGPHAWTPRQVLAAREMVARAGLLLASEPGVRLDLLDSVPIAPF